MVVATFLQDVDQTDQLVRKELVQFSILMTGHELDKCEQHFHNRSSSFFSGDSQDDGQGDGVKDEQAQVEPEQHAQGSPTLE